MIERQVYPAVKDNSPHRPAERGNGSVDVAFIQSIGHDK